MFGKVIQTDADVSTANYGGPLVDIRGRVLGVIVPMAPQATSEVAGAEWYDSGIGFAVPLAPLAGRIERMKKGEDQHAGILGIGMAAKNPHAAAGEAGRGAADFAGRQGRLQKGRRIVEIDGRRSARRPIFASRSARYAGESVRVIAKRGDETLEETVKLVGELEPFRHAFLGILPMRERAQEEAAEANGETPRRMKPDQPVATRWQVVVVRMVYPGSPAAAAGIKPGDRIVKIDDAEVDRHQVGHRGDEQRRARAPRWQCDSYATASRSNCRSRPSGCRQAC